MSEQKREPNELLGALLWLRNHYDVGRPSLKKQVLDLIDNVFARP